MDEEAASEMVGGMFSTLWEVEDGWAHYDEHFANEEGECTKEKFLELINGIIPWEDTLTKVLTKPLDKFYKMAGGSNEDQVEKFIQRLSRKIPTYLPIFASSIFRFFDTDGSGTISKSELVLTIGGFFGEDGPNPALALPGIFRILDADNSGSIEAVEVQPFITEIITAFAKLVTAIINELENDLKGGMKKKVIKRVQKMIDDAVENGMPYPFPKEDLCGMAAGTDMEEFTSFFELPIPQAVIDSAESTFTRFHEIANGEPMTIKKAAEVIAATMVPGLTSFCDPEVAQGMITMMNMEYEDKLPFDVSDLDLSDVIPVATSVASAYIKSGALKRYLEAILSFLDINNDGDITEKELRSIYDAGMKLKNESKDPESFSSNIQEWAGALFDIFDSDGSGTFDMDDVPKIIDKATELGVSIAYLQIEMAKTICVALVLPILNLGFNMFTEDGSISMEMVQGLVAMATEE